MMYSNATVKSCTRGEEGKAVVITTMVTNPDPPPAEIPQDTTLALVSDVFYEDLKDAKLHGATVNVETDETDGHVTAVTFP